MRHNALAGHHRRASSRRGIPGAVRRLGRERSRLVAVLLLASVAIAASGIQSSAAAALQATLDDNWRGAYDILVTSSGGSSDVGELLTPNSLASGGDGLGLDDLERIRLVGGVEVAAPIGEMVAPGLKYGSPTVTVPKGFVRGASETPQSFKVTTRYSTDDGLGPRVVSESSTMLVIDELPVEPPTEREVDESTASCSFEQYAITEESYPELWNLLCFQPFDTYQPITTTDDSSGWGGDDRLSNGAWLVGLTESPQSVTRVTLVDPKAEAQLLGEAGAFLAPLEQLAPSADTNAAMITAWAEGSDSDYAADFLEQEATRAAQSAGFQSEEIFGLIKQLYADNGADYEAVQAEQQGSYVPLLVSDAGAAPLEITVTVEPYGDAPRISGAEGYPYKLPREPTAGEAAGAPSSSTADVSALLNPFITTTATIPWPGSTAVEIDAKDVYNTLAIQYTGTVSNSPYTRAGSGVDLGAVGYHYPIPNWSVGMPNLLTTDDEAERPGSESVYVTTKSLPQSEFQSVAVPVGSFSNNAVAGLQSELSYVPLGAYEPINSTLDDGAVMNPSVSGLGLVGPRTVAIASIYSAETWGQENPISAVRVRVGGIEGYSDAALHRVVETATGIEALGYTATIVAGSSPTEVTVHVADYAFGVASIDEKQRVGDLGDVTQNWSELGAASRADLAISTATASILALALGSAALLLGAVQFASVPRRRAQAAVMREIGFTRGRIGRWMAAEEVPGLVVVVLAGLAAALLSGLTQLSLVISGAGVGVVVVTSAVAVGLGSRTAPRRVPRRATKRVRGRSIVAFGVRQGRIHSLTSSTHFLAILIVALSAAGLASVFLQGRANAGSSLLGQFAVGQATLSQIALGLTGVIAGLILAVLGRRVDLARRSTQWAVMRAMGWTSGQLKLAQRTEAVTIVVPAVLVSGVATWFGAGALDLAHPLLVTGVALAAAALASLVVLFVGRKAVTS